MSLSVIKTLKYILLLIIFGLSTSIGMAIAKAYGNRVDELKEFKNILNIMKTKIKFTYEPLGEIFKQIAKDNDTEIEKNLWTNGKSNNILSGKRCLGKLHTRCRYKHKTRR